MDIEQQPTAIDSYSIYRASGENLKKAILEYLRLSGEGKADYHIMRFFCKPRNIVSAARNSLYRSGKILKMDQTVKDDVTGRDVCLWKFNSGEAEPIEEKSAKMILTEIKKIIQEARSAGMYGDPTNHYPLNAYHKISDLVFSNKAIILPFKQANGIK